MARYTHKGIEYFVQGPNRRGRYGWYLFLKNKRKAGECETSNAAQTAAKNTIDMG
jgi:hypothetical protein